jgi:hypothetical protein
MFRSKIRKSAYHTPHCLFEDKDRIPMVMFSSGIEQGQLSALWQFFQNEVALDQD